MSETLHQFHFLRPAWLWLLLALPVIAWLATRGQGARAQLERLVDPELLPHLLQGRAQRRSVPPALLALGWVLAVLAFAGPSWSRLPQPLYADRAAQVVAISLSEHMLARDVAPSRLDRARYKARDLFAANRGGLNGLVAYAGEAFVVAPLTSDANSLNDLLDALAPDTMPVDGDDAAAAIARGTALIRDARVGGGSLILITDDAGASAVQAARQARADGVRVSVLGVGTTRGGPVPLAEGGFLRDAQGGVAMAGRDDTALAALAAAGGGRYVPMRADHADIDALQARLRSGGEQATGQASAQWEDRGPWLLLPLLPLLALAFRRGWLLLLPLVLLPLLPARAEAGTWQDLWQRRDQQATQALRQGHAKQALALARDPALRGAAAYRAGDYDAAVGALQPVKTTDAQYNLGNALARAGRYREALAAYDRALALDPRNADAKANRQAVEAWLRRQPPPQDGNADAQNQAGGKSSRSRPRQDDQSSKKDSQGNRRGEQQDGRQGSQGQQGRGEQPPEAQAGQESSGQHAGERREQQGANRPLTAQERAEQQARMARAGQALKQQLDRALGDKAGSRSAEHQLGALDKDDPQARLPAELRQALQRVPDDPGALLRRKFELEYRQRHGVANGEDLP
ncbi:MAG TPA: VWA domain-containing protein [Frateuria sp.]|uniref:VWA domain-containing protein n=1 Tax=Frateuria sp. TaxID=2211372 RepID=UPI002D7E9576|nr:VWA domain-containing protein [Frateuria sp.]HET6806253.1 VWA domain-containing protein [Frateuria sp.]